MPTPTDYIERLNFYERVLTRHTEGMTHEDSMRQLDFPANCMNWNLGHLLVYRVMILGWIDGETEVDEAEFALYGAGSEPLTDSDKAIPLETLLQRLQTAASQITAAFQAMPPARLDVILDAERGVTVNDRLSFYILFHEAYHMGQLEILRELALTRR